MSEMKEFEVNGLIRIICKEISDDINRDAKKPNAAARKRIRVRAMDLVRAAKSLKAVYAEAKREREFNLPF